jgi:type VI secretion system secreted protein Hcp
MAIPGYMYITDDQGSPVKGTVKVKGRENSVEVMSFFHEIRIPTDADTGRLTGTRKHEPFVIVKEFDSSTPILNKACSAGKTLNQVKINWYRINPKGAEEAYFRHTLSNAKVVSVKPIVNDVKDPTKEKYGHLEKVAFRYDKIQWEYLDGNIATYDEWTEKG